MENMPDEQVAFFPCETKCRYARESWVRIVDKDKKGRFFILPIKANTRKKLMVDYMNALTWCLTCKHFVKFDNFRTN